MRLRPALLLAAPAGVLGGHAIGYAAAPGPAGAAALHHGYLALVLAVAVPLAVLAVAWAAAAGSVGPARSAPAARGPVRPGPVRPGPVRPGPLRRGPLRSGSVRPGPARPGAVRPGPLRRGAVRPGSVGPLLVAQWVLFTGQEAVEHALAGHGAVAVLQSHALWWGLAAQVVTALAVVVLLRASAVAGASLVRLSAGCLPVALARRPWRPAQSANRPPSTFGGVSSARGPPAPRFA